MADIKVKSLSVNIPDEYMKVKPLPQEDPDSIIYGTEYEESLNIMFIEELECKDSLPFGRVGMLVDIIHNSLVENQGIIECNMGKTSAGDEYIYSIVKTGLDDSGVNYNLVLQMLKGGKVLSVQAICEERGITGIRDAIVFATVSPEAAGMNENGPFEGWMCDPFDPDYKKGLLMNLSEDRKYDEQFPEHPLTQARLLLKHLIENN